MGIVMLMFGKYMLVTTLRLLAVKSYMSIFSYSYL